MTAPTKTKCTNGHTSKSRSKLPAVAILMSLVLLSGCSAAKPAAIQGAPTSQPVAADSSTPAPATDEPVTSASVAAPYNVYKYAATQTSSDVLDSEVDIKGGGNPTSVETWSDKALSLVTCTTIDPQRDYVVPYVLSFKDGNSGFDLPVNQAAVLMLRFAPVATAWADSNGSVENVGFYTSGPVCNPGTPNLQTAEGDFAFISLMNISALSGLREVAVYGYLILHNYFSPANPAGAPGVLQAIYLEPQVGSANGNPFPTVVTGSGPWSRFTLAGVDHAAMSLIT